METKEFLAEKGYDPEYGARPLRRTIQRYIEDPLSQMLLEKTIPDGVELATSVVGDEIKFHVAEKALIGE